MFFETWVIKKKNRHNSLILEVQLTIFVLRSTSTVRPRWPLLLSFASSVLSSPGVLVREPPSSVTGRHHVIIETHYGRETQRPVIWSTVFANFPTLREPSESVWTVAIVCSPSPHPPRLTTVFRHSIFTKIAGLHRGGTHTRGSQVGGITMCRSVRFSTCPSWFCNRSPTRRGHVKTTAFRLFSFFVAFIPRNSCIFYEKLDSLANSMSAVYNPRHNHRSVKLELFFPVRDIGGESL